MTYLSQLPPFRRRRDASETGTFPLAIIDRVRPHLDRKTLANLRSASREIRDALDGNLPAALQGFALFKPGTMPRKQALVPPPNIPVLGVQLTHMDLAIAKQTGLRMLASMFSGYAVGCSAGRGAPMTASMIGPGVGLLTTCLVGEWSLYAYRNDAEARSVVSLEKRLAAMASPPEAPTERAKLLTDVHKATRLRLDRAHQALRVLPKLIKVDRLNEVQELLNGLPADIQIPEPLLIDIMEQALDPERHTNDVRRTAGEDLAAWLEQRGDLTSRTADAMQALQRIATESLEKSAYFRRAASVELRLRLGQQPLPPLSQMREVAWYMGSLLEQAKSAIEFPLLVCVAEMIVDRSLRIGFDWCLRTVQQLIRLEVVTQASLIERGEQLALQVNDTRTAEERAAAAQILAYVRAL